MCILYKLLWAVADSRVFHSTFIYQVTLKESHGRRGPKHAFNKGCTFQEPAPWCDRQGRRTHTWTETEQWARNRTGSPEKDKLRGQGGLGELAGRALRGSWNRRPNRPWCGWGECPTPIAQPEIREWGAVLNMATHAVHGAMRQDAGKGLVRGLRCHGDTIDFVCRS